MYKYMEDNKDDVLTNSNEEGINRVYNSGEGKHSLAKHTRSFTLLYSYESKKPIHIYILPQNMLFLWNRLRLNTSQSDCVT